MPSKIQLLLASGRAIIGSVPGNGTAAKAIRQSGGIVVAPESPDALAAAIMDLYANPALVATLGDVGRKFAVKRYSFKQALDQYEKLFSDAIAPQVSNLDIEKLF